MGLSSWSGSWLFSLFGLADPFNQFAHLCAVNVHVQLNAHLGRLVHGDGRLANSRTVSKLLSFASPLLVSGGLRLLDHLDERAVLFL